MCVPIRKSGYKHWANAAALQVLRLVMVKGREVNCALKYDLDETWLGWRRGNLVIAASLLGN